MATIGIDLGTTFSCVAVYRNKVAEVLANHQGKRTTPSIVSFKENVRLIGEEAKQEMGINPKNTVYGIKRLIGRLFDDETVQEDVKRWPFEVVKDTITERPNIKIEYLGRTYYFPPEEISAMILGQMKAIAAEYLGEEIKGAVITVPAYFNDGQRQATKQAAEIAQLPVLRIINEPTAAAIAYGLNNKLECKEEQQKVVVFDFGGGTLDVTVLVIEDDVFDVKSTKGDTHLGGEDFDNALVEHCITELEKKYADQKFRDDMKLLVKLKSQCEVAKMNLCNATTTTINIPCLIGEDDFQLKITRKQFDQMTKKLVDKVMVPVEDALKEAQFDPSDIHNVVLVGGSTKLTAVHTRLKVLFAKSQICMGINPDEAVAIGAAIQAAKLSGTETSEELRELVLMDVTPLSMGIQTTGGAMSVIIPRNTTVPVTKHKSFTTNANNQTTVNIKVYEGERPLTEHNHYLGEFKLTGLTSAAQGVVKINVSFHVDSDGVLSCTGVEEHEGRKPKEVRIQSKAGLLTKEDVARMIENAKVFSLKDQEEKERIEAKSNLENLCYRFNASMQSAENYGKDVNLRNTVMDICGVTLSWLSDNANLSTEEYNKKYKAIHDECDPIRRKLLNMEAEKCDDKDNYKYDSVDG